MSTRGEKSLATRAKQNIGICCETLCDREPVEKYIKQLEDLVAFYEEKENERYNIRIKERANALYEKG